MTVQTLTLEVHRSVAPKGAAGDAMVEMDDQVGAEDLALVESVQRGMEAGARDRGTLFLDSESLIAHFRDYVLDAVADRLDA